jgi:hypothetical protein
MRLIEVCMVVGLLVGLLCYVLWQNGLMAHRLYGLPQAYQVQQIRQLIGVPSDYCPPGQRPVILDVEDEARERLIFTLRCK